MSFLMILNIAAAATLNVPADHATLQGAIDASAAGDTIAVGAGLHTGPFAISHQLDITGDSAGGTILAGSGQETLLTVTTGNLEVVLIEDLTLKCGDEGVVDHSGGSLAIANVEIRGCSNLANTYGTIASHSGKLLTIDRLRVTGTTGNAPIVRTSSDAEISHITLTGGFWNAAALFIASDSVLTMTDIVARDMQIAGGIAHTTGMATVSLTRVESACTQLGDSALSIQAASIHLQALRIWKSEVGNTAPLVSLIGDSTVAYSTLLGVGNMTLLTLEGPNATLTAIALGEATAAIEVKNPMIFAATDSVIGTDHPIDGAVGPEDAGNNMTFDGPEVRTLLNNSSCDGDLIGPLPGGNLHRTGPVLDGTRTDIGATGGPEGWPFGVEADADGDGVLAFPDGEDCDDNDALTYPGAPEDASDIDRDCDGWTDLATPIGLRGCTTTSATPTTLFPLLIGLISLLRRKSCAPRNP